MLQLLVFAVAATAVLAAPTQCTARDVLAQCKHLMPEFNETSVVFPDTKEKLRRLCVELRDFAECVGNATDICVKQKTVDYTLKMLHTQVKIFSEACNKRGKLEETATAVLAAPTRCTARDVLEQCKEFMPKFNRTDVIFPDTIEKFRYICEELGEFAECVGNATDVCIKHKTGDYTLKMLHAQVKLFSEACNKRGKLEEMVVKLGKCYSENLQDFFNYCGIGLPVNEEDSKFQIKNKCKYNKKVQECYLDRTKKYCGKDVYKFWKHLLKLTGQMVAPGQEICRKYDD